MERCHPNQVSMYERRLSELWDQVTQLKATVAENERQLQVAQASGISADQILAAISTWPQRFAEAPVEMRRAMMADVIETVTWQPATNTVDVTFRFDPAADPSAFCRQDTTEGDPSTAFCLQISVPPLRRRKAS
jgi:hypothetical protein